ncbi:N-acetylmuramoyl-L-alanine amidase [Halosquirtibacter xylanolyticus]|uniref:N-acetylmuramoyl-L-alanine amidase n=1 Tax=Halosquirtibacter xylanolyticus TaxID=3374599 RepID=UPI0037490446|nr:N-acetylmuramoyl-L-alanine amidase [Prolixibacteraceae bacterium]
MRKITRIIIHCSDSDNLEHDNIQTVRRWHMERGWKDIGYHYFICLNGDIKWGRAVETIGAHCRGYNADSIGICLSGKYRFSDAQYASLCLLLRKLMKKFSIKKNRIYPHNHYNKKKTCPNFNLKEILMRL